jgi:hypothetical protein
MMNRWMFRLFCLTCISMSTLVGCAAATHQVVPTPRPTDSPTDTPSPTATLDATPTDATMVAQQATLAAGGATATPLFGSTSTPAPGQPTPTRVFNPNAPRVEFFQASGPVEPGGLITLLWSTRNVERAVIYQLNHAGERDRTWNVNPSGRQGVRTNTSDRGQIDFVMVIGTGEQQVEQRLTVPLICTVSWFFSPPPQECADGEASEIFLIEQRFERGRLVYIGGSENRIYALFNDGQSPAWIRFDDQYNPETHPEFDAAFQPPPGLYQPIARFGFLWRGNDVVRNRLGLGTEPELGFQGVIQRSRLLDGTSALYLTSPDGTVLQILGTGGSWQIITPN